MGLLGMELMFLSLWGQLNCWTSEAGGAVPEADLSQ